MKMNKIMFIGTLAMCVALMSGLSGCAMLGKFFPGLAPKIYLGDAKKDNAVMVKITAGGTVDGTELKTVGAMYGVTPGEHTLDVYIEAPDVYDAKMTLSGKYNFESGKNYTIGPAMSKGRATLKLWDNETKAILLAGTSAWYIPQKPKMLNGATDSNATYISKGYVTLKIDGSEITDSSVGIPSGKHSYAVEGAGGRNADKKLTLSGSYNFAAGKFYTFGMDSDESEAGSTYTLTLTDEQYNVLAKSDTVKE